MAQARTLFRLQVRGAGRGHPAIDERPGASVDPKLLGIGKAEPPAQAEEIAAIEAAARAAVLPLEIVERVGWIRALDLLLMPTAQLLER